jgi:cytochrome c oxidase assembly protein subunit 15
VVFFTITEAALGAKLVLFGLVGDNDSLARAYTMALHMVNSLLLMGSSVMCYFYARNTRLTKGDVRQGVACLPLFTFRHSGMMLAFLVVACTGAIASLSGTLFPSESLWGALQQDFAEGSHFLLRLRLSHPLMATLVGGALLMWAYYHWDSASLSVQRAAQRFVVVLLLAIFFGYATLFLLSPTWMKLTHLALAHALWVLFVLFLAELAWDKRPQAT